MQRGRPRRAATGGVQAGRTHTARSQFLLGLWIFLLGAVRGAPGAARPHAGLKGWTEGTMRVLAGIASGMVVLMLVAIAVTPGAWACDGDAYECSGRYPWWRPNTPGHSGWHDGGQSTDERVGQTHTNTSIETVHMFEPAHACTE